MVGRRSDAVTHGLGFWSGVRYAAVRRERDALFRTEKKKLFQNFETVLAETNQHHFLLPSRNSSSSETRAAGQTALARRRKLERHRRTTHTDDTNNNNNITSSYVSDLRDD